MYAGRVLSAELSPTGRLVAASPASCNSLRDREVSARPARLRISGGAPMAMRVGTGVPVAARSLSPCKFPACGARLYGTLCKFGARSCTLPPCVTAHHGSEYVERIRVGSALSLIGFSCGLRGRQRYCAGCRDGTPVSSDDPMSRSCLISRAVNPRFAKCPYPRPDVVLPSVRWSSG